MIARLNEDVQKLHVAHEPRYFKPADPAELRAWHTAFLSRPTCRAWLAEVRGAPVGYAVAEIRLRAANVFSHEYRWMEVDAVAVLPAFQERGIGTRLLDAAAQAASEEGISELQLSTWEFNVRAQAAFMRFGFRPKQHRYALELPRAAEPTSRS